MAEVVKGDGSREAFDIEKVRSSIKKAIFDAGLSTKDMSDKIEQSVSSVVELTKHKGTVTTETIRKQILNFFDLTEKRVSDAWRVFERKYKS